MKILVIRFSSIGDLTQALSIPAVLKAKDPKTEIHFVTRKDLASLTLNNPNINKTWELDKADGLRGLIRLIAELRKQNFTHIYDAHNNLRSFFIRAFISAPNKLVKPMYRWKRFVLLKFHRNLFEKPFSGQRDLLKPLENWDIKFELPPTPQIFLDESVLEKTRLHLAEFKLTDYIVLVPSAAYELKRWPIEYWCHLVKLNPTKSFVVLAGLEDNFTAALNTYTNVVNLTGKTSLLESAAIIKFSKAVVSNDTGLLHIAEQLGRPTFALMGPAPFGFPSRSSTTLFERDLKCRPCSKHGQGPCINPVYQDCLRGINPNLISEKLNQIL